MATVSIDSNPTYDHVVVRVRNLQYDVGDYDNFVVQIRSAGTGNLIFTYTAQAKHSTADDDYQDDASFQFINRAWFSPGNSYTVSVTAYYNGTGYPIGDAVPFTIPSISPPTGTIDPVFYPQIKNQGDYNTCVADCVTTMMEMFHSMKMNIVTTYEHYSVPYFYGSDEITDEWMLFEKAMQNATHIGCPRWELVDNIFPDHTLKEEAVSRYRNACALANENAKKQRISGYTVVQFYDCEAVADAIRNNGCYVFTFKLPENYRSIYSFPSSGVCPQPDYWSGLGHAILLIGLTKIDGKAHWIGVNSYGTEWGDGGLCYIPYDWGCGVESPESSGNTDRAVGWVYDCYAPYDNSVPTNHPDQPKIKSVKYSEDRSNATVTVETANENDYYLLYARNLKSGYEHWYPKSTDGGNTFGIAYQTSDGPITIPLDSSTGNYEFSVFAMRDYMMSLRSFYQPDIEPWTWEGANYNDDVAASAEDTKQFYKVLHGNADPYDGFSCKVWNDIVRKATQVVRAKGNTWYPLSELGSDKCKASKGEAVSAKKYNEVRFNIGSIKTTNEDGKPSTEVSNGDTIYGYHFERLTDVMNEIIDEL